MASQPTKATGAAVDLVVVVVAAGPLVEDDDAVVTVRLEVAVVDTDAVVVTVLPPATPGVVESVAVVDVVTPPGAVVGIETDPTAFDRSAPEEPHAAVTINTATAADGAT